MHRIDTTTAQKDKWGTGKNGWTNGDPNTGVKATSFNASFCDSIQEEICNVIEKSGSTLDSNDNTQLWKVLSTSFGKYLAIENNLSEIAAAGTSAQSAARGNLDLGTAATANIVTSPTDTTAGHVMTVGFRGLGLIANTVITGFDFNAYRFAVGEGLFVQMTSALNIPAAISSLASTYCYIDIIGVRDGTTNDCVFIISNYQTTQSFIVWRQTDESKNIVWNSLNLNQWGDYLPLAGGDLAGQLSVTDSLTIAGAHPTLSFLESDTGKKYFVIVDGAGFRIEEDATSGHEIISYAAGSGQVKIIGEVVPGNYANFDARYVSNVQLGAEVFTSTSKNIFGGSYRDWIAPAGCMIDGIHSYNSNDREIQGIWYKPIQKYINGAWVTIAG